MILKNERINNGWCEDDEEAEEKEMSGALERRGSGVADDRQEREKRNSEKEKRVCEFKEEKGE